MDIQAALRDGYTANEIMAELGRRTGMNYKQALSDGYSQDEVLAELNKRDTREGVASEVGPKQTPTELTDEEKFAAKNPNLYAVLKAGKEVARFGGETAGLVGGGLLGAPLGPAGAVAGAGLGYGGVKALERALEGEKATLPQAALTSLKDVGTGTAMEMGGQIAGKVIGGTLEKISKPSMSNLPAEVISERMAKARELGIELSPAELTGSKGLALYESMLDKSPFSTSVINTWRELRQLKPMVALREKLLSKGGTQQTEVIGQQIKEQVDKFLSQYKSLNESQLNALRDNVLKKMGSVDTYENIGKSVQELIAKRSKDSYEQAGKLYDAVEKSIPQGTMIQTTNLKNTAQKLLDIENGKSPSLQNPQIKKVLEDLSGAKSAIDEEIAQYPEVVQAQIKAKMEAEGVGGKTWRALQADRSELNSRIAQSDAAMKTAQPGAKFQSTPEAGVYKQLRKALDADIKAFADETGGDVKAAFDTANAFYKEGKLVYNAPEIRKMLSAHPEKMVDMIFRPQGGMEIDLIEKAIGKEAFEKTLKPAFTKRLLGETEVFSPRYLQTNLEHYGKDILNKVYNKDELKILNSLVQDGRIQMEDSLAGHPFLKTIAKEKPETVIDSILGSYEKFPGSKNVLKNTLLIRATVDKPTFQSLQREMSDRIFKLNQITDQIQPEKLAKTVQTYEKVLQTIYTPEQVSWLKQISDTGKLMASAERLAANPSGTAQNVVTWGTWGVIIRSLKSGQVGETLSGLTDTIIAPRYMAKLYLSDAGRKYFTLGMKTPIGTKAGTAIAAKLAEIAGVDIAEQD